MIRASFKQTIPSHHRRLVVFVAGVPYSIVSRDYVMYRVWGAVADPEHLQNLDKHAQDVCSSDKIHFERASGLGRAASHPQRSFMLSSPSLSLPPIFHDNKTEPEPSHAPPAGHRRHSAAATAVKMHVSKRHIPCASTVSNHRWRAVAAMISTLISCISHLQDSVLTALSPSSQLRTPPTWQVVAGPVEATLGNNHMLSSKDTIFLIDVVPLAKLLLKIPHDDLG
jgi:hypothetical protein